MQLCCIDQVVYRETNLFKHKGEKYQKKIKKEEKDTVC